MVGMAFFDPREKARMLVKVNMQEDKGTEEPLHRLDSTSDSRQTAELLSQQTPNPFSPSWDFQIHFSQMILIHGVQTKITSQPRK